MDRPAALALLEAHHTFPTDHCFRAIVAAGAGDAVLAAIVEAWGEPARVEQVPSRGGRWTSLRITLRCPTAAHVLDVYAHLQGMPEVVRVL